MRFSVYWGRLSRWRCTGRWLYLSNFQALTPGYPYTCTAELYIPDSPRNHAAGDFSSFFCDMVIWNYFPVCHLNEYSLWAYPELFKDSVGYFLFLHFQQIDMHGLITYYYFNDVWICWYRHNLHEKPHKRILKGMLYSKMKTYSSWNAKTKVQWIGQQKHSDLTFSPARKLGQSMLSSLLYEKGNVNGFMLFRFYFAIATSPPLPLLSETRFPSFGYWSGKCGWWVYYWFVAS